MNVVFFGAGEFAVPTLRSIRGDGHEILRVVTQPDRARGRGQSVSATPVKAEALEAGLGVMTTADVNADSVVEELRGLRADLAYVAAFGQKLGPAVLGLFPLGGVNLHASLLPAYRGAAPIQWAIINGETHTGVSVFRLVQQMDAGPVLVQRQTAIRFDETADEVHDRLARIGCDAVRAALELLAADANAPGQPQDPSKATAAPKLKKTDGLIRFDQPAERVAKRICGMWSWPGAQARYTSADGRRQEVIALARAASYEGPRRPAASTDQVGRITETMSVQAADGEVALLEVKPAGGRLMPWRDFVNGRHVQAGDRLEAIEACDG